MCACFFKKGPYKTEVMPSLFYAIFQTNQGAFPSQKNDTLCMIKNMALQIYALKYIFTLQGVQGNVHGFPLLTMTLISRGWSWWSAAEELDSSPVAP